MRTFHLQPGPLIPRLKLSAARGATVLLYLVLLGPPASASTNPPCGTVAHFLPGVNLDGWTGGATYAEQEQSVGLMRQAGVRLVRINTPWHALEPGQKGVYDTNLLGFYDHIVPLLSSNHIGCIFVNATTPYWASADPAKYSDQLGDHWNPNYKPLNVTNYSDFLVFLANRYQGFGSNYFEVWNEENDSFFWPPAPNAADYFVMLRSAYAALKQAAPGVTVLNGGLSDESNTAAYLNSLYTAGARPFFDIFSQHAYPRTPTNETVISAVHTVMFNHADGNKPVWVTEFGWPTYTNASDPNAVNLSTQAQYLAELFTRLASYPYVGAGFWYNLRSFDETQKEGSFGLLLPDFSKKPAFDAFQAWATAAAASCPPQITLSQYSALNGFQIGFTGTTGFSYSIESSTNLRDWVPLTSNITSTNASFQFIDTNRNSVSRFYRVAWP